MILKIVRQDEDGGAVEYFDGDSVIKTFKGKVGDSKERSRYGVQVIRSGKMVFDHELYNGDVAYILEHGKIVDSFVG